MSPSEALFLASAGFAAGVINSIAGGGTLVTFPALLFIGGHSITANITSTVALVPGNLGSAFGYRKLIPAVAPWLKIFLPVSLAGALLGSWLLTRTPTTTFDHLIPFLLLFATALFIGQSVIARATRGGRPEAHTRSAAWLAGAAVFQFGVAVYGGYFGAGIGILMLASFGLLGFRDINEMNTLKVVLSAGLNLVSALYFIATSGVNWPHAAAVAVGALLGGYAGSHYAQKLPQNAVRGLVMVVGLTITAVLFYRQFLR